MQKIPSGRSVIAKPIPKGHRVVYDREVPFELRVQESRCEPCTTMRGFAPHAPSRTHHSWKEIASLPRLVEWL